MGDIDFANSDSRMTYLKENLGHLMKGIDANYGQVLMDELMRRMEATVSEFNEEVKAMLGRLQGIKPIPQDNILASSPHPEPKTSPLPNAAPAPPTTELRPTQSMEESASAPAQPQASTDPKEPKPFKEEGVHPDPLKAVEIEVDLKDEELSDFEKKLRSLTS